MSEKALSRVPVETIERAILRVRGQNIMLDSTLAALYRVEVRVLNQAVKRNSRRFPADFMFRLTPEEAASVRSQNVILENGRGRYRKYRPNVFTEQGVAMLSSVLHSPRAVRVNIEIMRTFVQLRRMLGANTELARKLGELEQQYDAQFKVVFRAIRELMAPSNRPRRNIGFRGPTGKPAVRARVSTP